MTDHRCVRSDGTVDNDDTACVDGMIYTTCGHENCTGVCVDDGDCDCACHDEEAGYAA